MRIKGLVMPLGGIVYKEGLLSLAETSLLCPVYAPSGQDVGEVLAAEVTDRGLEIAAEVQTKLLVDNYYFSVRYVIPGYIAVVYYIANISLNGSEKIRLCNNLKERK